MSRRGRDAARCQTCHLHLELCVCAALPSLVTTTRLVLVVHRAERHKPSSTAWLLARMLPGASVVVRGVEGERAALAVDGPAVVLFPSVAAVPITEVARPATLIVPDGTWGQARQMCKREPELARWPHVRLSERAAALPSLRRPPYPGALSTGEAVARALGLFEGEPLEAALYDGLLRMMERVQWARGRLPTAQLTHPPPDIMRQAVGRSPRGRPDE